MSEEKTIEQLLAELKAARETLDTGIEEHKAADNRETDARNIYNGICKCIDAAVQKLRANSPWNTTWYETAKKAVEI